MNRIQRPLGVSSLASIHRKKALGSATEGLLLLLTCSLLTLVFTGLVEILFDLDPAGRFVLLMLIVLAAAIPFTKFVLPHLIRLTRSPRREEITSIAMEVGAKFPELKDRLRNAIELSSMGQPSFHSEELATTYIEKIFDRSSNLDFVAALEYGINRFRLLACLGSAVLFAGVFILFPVQMPNAIGRILNFTESSKRRDERWRLNWGGWRMRWRS